MDVPRKTSHGGAERVDGSFVRSFGVRPTRPLPRTCRGFLISQAIFICFHFPVMSTLHILIFLWFLNRILRYYLDQIDQTRTATNLKRRLERFGYVVSIQPKEVVPNSVEAAA